ncbi:MAG: hypothetical protein WBL63_08305 [Candidatus Acidiferrum sp.]
MAVKVKRITLWRKELENRAGTLAGTLQPLANAGTDLQIVMGYRYPGDSVKAVVELYPIGSKKGTQAAQGAGLAASTIPVLFVEGDNRAGLGHGITQAIAEAGVNLDFLVAQVIGRKYSAVIGFENEADATKASALIKKAVAGKKK